MVDGIAERSTKVKRHGKKLRLATVSISQQQVNETNRISERGSNPSPEQHSNMQRLPSPHVSSEVPNEVPNEVQDEVPEEQSVEEHELSRKRKRGPTKLIRIGSNPGDRVEVEFNERGQPIGLHSEWLSSLLGALARELVPVTTDDWRKVSPGAKEDLWTCVKKRFKVDELYKKLFIQAMGNRWRECKSRLITSLREASKLPDKESKFALLRPDNIKSDEQWNLFLEKKLSNEFKARSEKYKKIRAKNKTPHTMSRKGYARLEDEMRKENPEMPIRREDVWCRAHTKKNGEVPTTFIADCMSKMQEFSSSQTSPLTSLSINEDALSHVLGPERNGRVRGMGFGITPSKIGVHINSSKKVQALENQVSELKNEMGMMKQSENEKIKHLENEMEKMKQFIQGLALKENANSNMSSTNLHCIGSRDNVIRKTPTPPSYNGGSNVHDCKGLNSRDAPTSVNVEKKCKLLNWQKKVVAEAKLASTDPKVLVHNVPLGKDDWKVWVLAALDPTAHLWRPNSEMTLIGDAVGSTVAWHKAFISFD